MQILPLSFLADPLPGFHSYKSLQELEQGLPASIRMDGTHYQTLLAAQQPLTLPQCPPASPFSCPLPQATEPGCPWGSSHTDHFAQALELQTDANPNKLPDSQPQGYKPSNLEWDPHPCKMCTLHSPNHPCPLQLATQGTAAALQQWSGEALSLATS